MDLTVLERELKNYASAPWFPVSLFQEHNGAALTRVARTERLPLATSVVGRSGLTGKVVSQVKRLRLKKESDLI